MFLLLYPAIVSHLIDIGAAQKQEELQDFPNTTNDMSMDNFRFIVADHNSNGIIALQPQLEKDFSTSLCFVHNIEQLSQELDKDKAAILLYDLDFLGIEQAIPILTQIRTQVPQLSILPIVSRKHTSVIRDLVTLQLFFYIMSPITYKDLKVTICRALEAQSLNKTKGYLQSYSSPEEENKSNSFHGMLGISPSMKSLFHIISKVSEDDFSTVLIRGESGTGKEMVAKAIHKSSPRAKHNFVPVNCAAIPDELLESELFGYTKGAFTGAHANKIGRIQYADKGTLFLDEIGDMKPSLQAKLLRVLQEREFEPVGGFKAQTVDTRVLAATHCNLEQLVKEGKFREDLYYRLSVIPIEIPPLYKRKEDLPLLTNQFIKEYTTKRARAAFSFSPEAMATLLQYNWPGNVRELENLIQHMSVLYAGSVVEKSDLPLKFIGKDHNSPEMGSAERQELWTNPIALPKEYNKTQGQPEEHELPDILTSHATMADDIGAFTPKTFTEPIVDSFKGSTATAEATNPTLFEDFGKDDLFFGDMFSTPIIHGEEQPVSVPNLLEQPFGPDLNAPLMNGDNGLSPQQTEVKDSDTIEFPAIYWGEAGIDFNELVGSFENQLIIKALQKSHGNKKEAAILLGLKRTTLLEKIKKKGLHDNWEQIL